MISCNATFDRSGSTRIHLASGKRIEPFTPQNDLGSIRMVLPDSIHLVA